MKPKLVPPARILPRDPEVLAQRARALAGLADESDETGHRDLHPFLLFRVAELPCAIEMSAVIRAVSRLGRVVSVPTNGGGERTVAFVEERPLAVVDLAAASGAKSRSVEELQHAPALVLAAGAGRLAVAVEGPLELAEEAVVDLSPGDDRTDPALPRIRGRLRSGASLYDSRWMTAWAAGAVGA